MRKISLFSLLLAGLMSIVGCSKTETADMVVKNGLIYTENEAQPKAEAMAIKDGKILFVGTNKEVEGFIGDSTKVQDLAGKTIIPSFIDSHTHPGLVGVTSTNGELAKYQLPSTSKEDIYAYLRQVAKENPELPFLMIGEWDVRLFGTQGPDRAELDKIFPKTIVVLLDSSGHSYWLNSAAFAAFGIDENTPDLKEGLSFLVKDKNGRKTGWVKEFALVPYLNAMMAAKPEYVKPGLESYLNYLASKGVSTVMDAGSFGSEEAVFQAVHQLEEEGKLPVRYEATHHLYMPQQLEGAVDKLLEYKKKYEGELLTFNTIKIHFDGVNEVNTAALLEDFANEKGNKGGMLYNKEELKDLLLRLAEHKFNLHLHTVGDRSTRTALDAMEAARKEYGGELPVQLTLSHLEVVSPEDMQRFKELGVHANFTPHWVGGTVFKGSDIALGQERYSHDQPINSLIQAGANVTFSSDVVSKPQEYRANPFLGIQMGATRQEASLGKDAEIFGQKSDRASVADMVKGYTINNAKQMGLDKEIGSLEVGKWADFIVLDKDIFNMDVYEISKLEPSAIYCLGTQMK